MSNFLVSLLAAAGAGTWIYNRFQRYTGGQTKRSLMVAAISSVLIFLVFLAVMNLVFKD